MTISTPWVACHKPRDRAKLRLFCLPHAGGAAQAFGDWQEEFPDWIEVCPIQLPGRWTRRRERAYTAMAPLVDDALAALAPWLDIPFAFFGHSLGALVAFEMARALEKQGQSAPSCLVVAARRAPQIPVDRQPIAALPDDAFVKEMLSTYGGIPDQVLAEPELLEMVLPILRADMQIFEGYGLDPGPPLTCPVVALGGTADPNASREQLEAWSLQTRSSLAVRLFPGGHFFTATARADVLPYITSSLEKVMNAIPNASLASQDMD